MAKNNKKFFGLAAIFASAVFAVPAFAEASTLFLSPSSGSYSIGQSFSVSVYVNSSQSMNAASGAISYPQDKLQVVSLSKSGSIFSLWVQEPAASGGNISLEGVVLNPGFTGSKGKLLTINFKAKAAGSAVLKFSSGSVLANDGQATNILSGSSGATFNIGGEAKPSPSTQPLQPAASSIHIVSRSHPDQNSWYNNKNLELSWELPVGTESIRLLLDKLPGSTPEIIYSPPVNSKEFAGLDEGVWYFHLQAKTGSNWGTIAHYRVQIDSQAPEKFFISFPEPESDNPRPQLELSAADSLSGLSMFKVKIGEGDFFDVLPDQLQNGSMALPLQYPGKRNIVVQAIDRAGNFATTLGEFDVLPIAPPAITEYTKRLQDNECLNIKGTAYPDSLVRVFAQGKEGPPDFREITTDSQGLFDYTWDKTFKAGKYKVWAEAADQRGAMSYPSEKIAIKVSLSDKGKLALGYIIVIAGLILAVLGLSLLVIFAWHRIKTWRKSIKKELYIAELDAHKEFLRMQKEISDEIAKFDGKPGLNEKEAKAIKEIKGILEESEEEISKEIKSIGKFWRLK